MWCVTTAMERMTSRTSSKGKGTRNFCEGDYAMLRKLWEFLKVRKKFWLLPLIIFLLLVGFLIVFVGGSAIAPFIYTIF